MDRSPKIMVVTDEPMLMVTMMSELEDRGFSVEPVKPGEHRTWSQPKDIDAAVFDLHQLDEVSLRLAYKLRRSAIPLVTLSGGSSFNSVQIAGAQTCRSSPVDYDRLADILFDLISHPLVVTAHARAGAFQHPDVMVADDR